jgi:hypothetical protein
MDLQACKEDLSTLSLVNHEETWGKPIPKHVPPWLSRALALCVGKGNFGWWLEKARMILNTEGLACLPLLPTPITWPG